MTRPIKQTIEAIIAMLRAGERPTVTVDDLPCFSETALRSNPNITPQDLDTILDSLTAADIPTFEYALNQIENNVCAWLGFKIITDPLLALDSTDTEVVGFKGKGQGSADAQPLVFVGTIDDRIVASRPPSRRDLFQMADITHGPHMHNEQYAGVAWLSIPLEQNGRVFVFGAAEIASYLELLAQGADFETIVVDTDEKYLNKSRLPLSRLELIESYSSIGDLGITKQDYVLILTRGHMHDPEVMIYSLTTDAHYIGMMGGPPKNSKVWAIVEPQGITKQQFDSIRSPVGLLFGAKTAFELALCIVAELIQVRYDGRKLVSSEPGADIASYRSTV